MKPVISKEKLSSKSSKSFAEVLDNVSGIPISQLPTPYVKGDRLSISIPNVEYLIGLDSCKHNLHGRIM